MWEFGFLENYLSDSGLEKTLKGHYVVLEKEFE